MKEGDDEVEALADFSGFQKALSIVGIVDELLGDGVGRGRCVIGAVEDVVDLIADLGRKFLERHVDCGSEENEVVLFFIVRKGGV